MPVDISFVFEDEKPAGKRGFVKIDGEDMRFEDGTLARFWGVNVNGGACFPDKDYAPMCAQRLAQAGCNMIRFHQMDADWDTPRTKCVYGSIATNTHGNSNFTAKLSGITLDGMEVVGKTDFGVIALSSLTNDPIEESDNMLLTTIGRARNTDAIFDGEKMLDVGKTPIMCEVIQGTIRIKTKHGKHLKVWGVNAEGFYSGDHATTYEDGWLQFEVGDINNPACYYLILKE